MRQISDTKHFVLTSFKGFQAEELLTNVDINRNGLDIKQDTGWMHHNRIHTGIQVKEFTEYRPDVPDIGCPTFRPRVLQRVACKKLFMIGIFARYGPDIRKRPVTKFNVLLDI